ncbi:MAG: type II toxin-antitoxin system VapC family toxin [Coxiellaceae bacterium]|nr:type II toxin-antitoxin system VapC family toxin [Coxiellaceae bacterium]
MTLRYLLDTHMCIHIAQHRPHEVLARFERLKVGEVSMSAVTYGELLFGAENSSQKKQSIQLIEQLASLIPPLPICMESGKYYGALRAMLDKEKQMLGNSDLWIAAQALALKTTLVTNRPQQFEHVPRLKCENWVH